MAKNFRNREAAGQENNGSIQRIILELLDDLVAFGEGSGLPCTNCKCILGFHIIRDTVHCNHCGCGRFKPYLMHVKEAESYTPFSGRAGRECVKCGRIKLLEEFCDDGSSCRRCNGMLRTYDDLEYLLEEEEEDLEVEALDEYFSRTAAARMALVELTE